MMPTDHLPPLLPRALFLRKLFRNVLLTLGVLKLIAADLVVTKKGRSA